MKRILDIGDLGATYVEHDTPIVKPTIYKPKPTPGSNGVTPDPYPPPSWTPPNPSPPRPNPTPPRPSPAPPSPSPPSPPPAPSAPEVPARRESNALPWVIGAMSVLLAGSFAWAVRHAYTPGDVR